MAELEVDMARARNARPLSPHLQIYRPMLTMMMSIVHRITGAALYFGMALLAWWLMAAASGPYVEFHNLTIDNKVNTGRGTFSAVDSAGNEISEYDWSHFFTLGQSGYAVADTTWTRVYAGLGTGVRIDTLRGVISTASGSEGPRGYRVAPLYPSDSVFGIVPPLLTTHRRNPVVVPPDSTPTISVTILEAASALPLPSQHREKPASAGSFLQADAGQIATDILRDARIRRRGAFEALQFNRPAARRRFPRTSPSSRRPRTSWSRSV